MPAKRLIGARLCGRVEAKVSAPARLEKPKKRLLKMKKPNLELGSGTYGGATANKGVGGDSFALSAPKSSPETQENLPGPICGYPKLKALALQKGSRPVF